MAAEENGDWWSAYERWVENAPLRVLQCRRDGHDFPHWEDIARPRTRSHARRVGRVVEVALPCRNKCGVHRTQFVDPVNGFLTRSNKIILDYSETGGTYLIPKEARSGRGFTREQRGLIRAESIIRLDEWITQED